MPCTEVILGGGMIHQHLFQVASDILTCLKAGAEHL